jgi:hypothetical protein
MLSRAFSRIFTCRLRHHVRKEGKSRVAGLALSHSEASDGGEGGWSSLETQQEKGRVERDEEKMERRGGSKEMGDGDVDVYVGLGSNLGDRVGNFRSAVQMLEGLPHTRVVRTSYLYESEPVLLEGPNKHTWRNPSFRHSAVEFHPTKPTSPPKPAALTVTASTNSSRIQHVSFSCPFFRLFPPFFRPASVSQRRPAAEDTARPPGSPEVPAGNRRSGGANANGRAVGKKKTNNKSGWV